MCEQPAQYPSCHRCDCDALAEGNSLVDKERTKIPKSGEGESLRDLQERRRVVGVSPPYALTLFIL